MPRSEASQPHPAELETAPPGVSEETFEQYSDDLSTRYLRIISIIEVLSGPGLWWTTDLMRAGQPEHIAAFRPFQIGFGIAGALTVPLYAIRSLSGRTCFWIAVANLFTISTGLGISTAISPEPMEIPFHTIPCFFFIMVWTVRRRSVAMGGMGVGFAVGALAAAGERALTDRDVFSSWLYFSMVAFTTAVLGHLVYRVVRDNWYQRRALAELTARIEKEKDVALDARRRAEAAALAKTQFLAAASHDLRQPLHAQALFLDALTHAVTTPEAVRLVERIGDTHRSASELLEGLLDVSKLDAGVVVPVVRPCAVASLFAGLAREFTAAARAKGLDLRIVPSSVWIEADPLLVTRVLQNLVSNAIRYTDRGRVVVGAKRRGERIELVVLDTGCGIPEEASESIFEEFVQLQNPERDRRRGIGLGLAIVRRLTSLMGANLRFHSEVGRGSAFAVSLPRAPAMSEVTPREDASSGADVVQLWGKAVLIVDDEVLVLEAMQTYLESAGCVVHAASSGEEALALVASGATIDAIVADYRLRGQETGLAVLERVRSVVGDALPALIVTGDTAPERIRDATAFGWPLLHKPITAPVLVEALVGAMSAAVSRDLRDSRGANATTKSQSPSAAV